MSRICVIGIDGATWELLDPAIKNGKLPNISNIKNSGVFGKLKSTMPPATGSAWPSFSTGCHPDKHGVFDFVKVQENHKTEIVTAEDIKVPTIFEYMDAAGKKSVIINHPLTYGLKLDNGVIFADFLSPKRYAYPRNAEKYLGDYRLFWNSSNLIQSKPEVITEDILDVEKKRLKLVLKMIKKKWDLFFVLCSGTDWISHRYYSEMDKMSEKGKIGFRVFEFVDNAVGIIKDELDDDTILIIMSDHGFSSKNYSFNVNYWLASQGYLKYVRNRGKEKLEGLKELRIIQQKTSNYGKTPFFVQFEKIIKKIVLDLLIKISFIKKYGIDWNTSLAYIPSHNCFGIYVTRNKVKDYIKFTKELILKLRELSYPQTGEKVFSVVDTTENIYGKKPEDAPDILFLLNDKFSHSCVTSYTSRSEVKVFSEMNGDDHALYGIFMAYGKHISSHGTLEHISIVDIAPTILNLMGYASQKHMDGKSFAEQIYTKKIKDLRPIEDSRIRKIKADLEKERIKERLKAVKILRGRGT